MLPAVVAMFRTTGEVALVLGEVNDVSKPRLRQWAPWPCAPGGTQLPVPELAANHAETRPRYCLLERA